MTVSEGAKGEVLIRALPYIRRYMGKTVVVKYGGAAMVNEGVRSSVIQDVILMNCVGIRTVLVHGGGPEIDSTLRRLGKEPEFVDGLRYTDEETMDIVQMVLAGKVNKDLVARVQRQGGRAIGLCGMDGGLFIASKHEPGGRDLGFVGSIEEINPQVVVRALDEGFIPVVATVAMGKDEDEHAYNVNADTAASRLAAAMGAEKLILLTDVPGILRERDDEGTLIKQIGRSEIGNLVRDGVVSKGMIPKLECCAFALDSGVKRTHIVDGRAPHALLVELFSDEGAGTMIL